MKTKEEVEKALSELEENKLIANDAYYKGCIKTLCWVLDNTNSLKPCPFCGEKEIKIYKQEGNHFAYCTSCRASTESFRESEKEETVRNAWNKRIKE